MKCVAMMSRVTGGGKVSRRAMQSSSVLRASPLSLEEQTQSRMTCGVTVTLCAADNRFMI